MKLDIPDHIVRRAEANSRDVLFAVAVQFYADNRLDHDDAVALSGLTPKRFDRELIARGICVHHCRRSEARQSDVRRAAG